MWHSVNSLQAGAIGSDSADNVRRMTDRMSQRGPGAEGMWS